MIVELPVTTRLDTEAERIMAQAKDADLQGVVVIGYRKDGTEYFASSIADGADVVWLMERTKLKLMQVAE